MATTSRQVTPDVMGAMLAGGVGTLKQLRATEIRLDGGTQPRAGIDAKHVQELAADVENGALLPPLDVTYDGAHYWLWDGYHRLAAWRKLRGDGVLVDVRVHQGSQADAQWASYAANKAHGLRRTNEDKQRAVVAALKHPNGASRANRDIARYLGVDEATVRHWREKLEAGAEIPQVTQRTGADGKTYATAGIGAQQQARAATFGEYLQAVRDAVAVAIGQAATTEQRLRWLTVTTIEALMATAPGADRNSVERARRMVLADWVAAVKAEQAAQRVQPETLDQCIAAVWAYVKEEGKTPAERLAALRTALMPHLRRGIHFADSALTVQAKATVVAELERQIEHERQKEARRAAQGGGSASARASGATSAAQSGPARQIEPAEPTTGEDRTSKLHRLKLLFMQCTDALTLWSQMTGREVITLEARRGLRAVIDATSALSDGQAGMDGEGEEVAA